MSPSASRQTRTTRSVSAAVLWWCLLIGGTSVPPLWGQTPPLPAAPPASPRGLTPTSPPADTEDAPGDAGGVQGSAAPVPPGPSPGPELPARDSLPPTPGAAAAQPTPAGGETTSLPATSPTTPPTPETAAPTPQPGATGDVSPQPLPTPADDVAAAVEAAQAQASACETALGDTSVLTTARAELSSIEDSLATLLRRQEAKPPQRMSGDQLDNLTRAWKQLDARVSSQQQSLTDWQVDTETRLLQVSSTQGDLATWLTRAQLSNASVTLIERIRTLRSQNEGSIRQGRSQLKDGSDLQRRLREIHHRCIDSLSLLQAAAEQRISDYSVADSPVLWKAPLEREKLLNAEGVETLKSQMEALRTYLTQHGMRVVAHLGLFGALLLLLLRLQRALQAYASDEETAPALPQILNRPVEAAIVLSMTALDWLYPAPPALLAPLLGLVGLLPAVRLLQPLVTARVVLLMQALIAAYLCDVVRELLSSLVDLNRLLCTAQMILGAAFLVYYRRMVRDQGRMVRDQGRMVRDQGRMVRDQGRMVPDRTGETLDDPLNLGRDTDPSAERPPHPDGAPSPHPGQPNDPDFTPTERASGVSSVSALGTDRIALVALVGLVAATLANLLGYFNLASLLTHTVTHAGYLGLGLYALLRLLYGIARVSLRVPPANRLNAVIKHRDLVERRLRRTLLWTGYLAWAYGTLVISTLRAPVAAWARRWLQHDLVLDTSALDVLRFSVVLAAAFWTSRLVRFVVEEDVFPRVRLERGLPYIISTLLHYSIVSVGLLLALAAFGTNFERLTVLAGALSVGLGFGLQTVVNSFVSGLILLFERPFKIGDRITLKNMQGHLVDIGLRSSRIAATDGSDVIVPNGLLLSTEVINETTAAASRLIEIEVRTTAATPPLKTLGRLVQIAQRHSEVASDPEPQALLLDIEEDRLRYQLRVWVGSPETWKKTRSDLLVGIYEGFSQAGIDMAPTKGQEGPGQLPILPAPPTLIT